MNFNLAWKKQEEKSGYESFLLKNKKVIEEVLSNKENYSNSLGWFQPEKWGNKTILNRLKTYAQEIRNQCECFILIGVGGSNNAARAVIKALQGENDSIEIIYAGNSLSASELNKIIRKVERKSFCINCIAKNFETLEPGYSFRVFRQLLEKKYGKEAKKRIFVTGTKNSTLEVLANKEGYNFLEFPMDIGGRYSSLTSVNLFPMAVAGIDIEELVEGGERLAKTLLEDNTINNIAYRYASYRQYCYSLGKKVELLSSFEPQFSWFKKWWIQLFAESEGKNNQGIYPTAGEFTEELHSLGQFIQDGSPILFETFLNVTNPQEDYEIQPDEKADYFSYLDHKSLNKVNQIAFNATYNAHKEKMPVGELTISKMSEESFGELFYFFEFSCYLSCEILGVNPFDQPGVENYKKLMFKSLK